MINKVTIAFVCLMNNKFNSSSIQYVNSLNLNPRELQILLNKIIKTNNKNYIITFIQKINNNILNENKISLMDVTKEQEFQILNSFKKNGLISTVKEYNINDSKEEIKYFLTKNSENLELITIYINYFFHDLTEKELEYLDLRCVNYYKSEIENSNIKTNL